MFSVFWFFTIDSRLVHSKRSGKNAASRTEETQRIIQLLALGEKIRTSFCRASLSEKVCWANMEAILPQRHSWAGDRGCPFLDKEVVRC